MSKSRKFTEPTVHHNIKEVERRQDGIMSTRRYEPINIAEMFQNDLHNHNFEKAATILQQEINSIKKEINDKSSSCEDTRSWRTLLEIRYLKCLRMFTQLTEKAPYYDSEDFGENSFPIQLRALERSLQTPAQLEGARTPRSCNWRQHALSC